MKIGIMTFWESVNNYGQILQLFASQQVLKKMGHEPFLIKYYRVPKKSKTIKARCRRAYNSIRSVLSKRNNDYLRQFEVFKQERIIFGNQSYFSLEDLVKNPPQADAYYVGSDQVWNNKILVPAEAFLLGFGSDKIKKVAYAASFGHKTLDEKDHMLFDKNIHNIDSLGLRETSGVEICKNLGRSDATLVLDPTMLLNLDEWINFLSLNQKKEENRIFIYTLGNSDVLDKDKFVAHSKQLGGLSILHASANNDSSGGIFPTLEQWVNYIKDSKLVITTSFHGIIFCLICNTNFIVLPNTGKASGMNERIKSILSLVGLEDHIQERFDETLFDEILSKQIDWHKVNSQIAAYRSKSYEFLEGAF